MAEELNGETLEGALEALLFVSGEPVSAITLADALEIDPLQVTAALESLREKFAAQSGGLELSEVAGGWQLRTRACFHDLLERYVLSWDTRKLSRAALEVLAIVAWAQPVTRQGIANVRGVNSDSPLNSLIEKGLVREAGCAEAPGNPILYATSRTFLEKFGLRSLEDLPALDEYAPDNETRQFIRQRLSAAHVVPSLQIDTSEGATEAAQAGAGEGSFSSRASVSQRDGNTVQENASARLFSAEELSSASAATPTPTATLLDASLAQVAGVVEKVDFDDLEFEE